MNEEQYIKAQNELNNLLMKIREKEEYHKKRDRSLFNPILWTDHDSLNEWPQVEHLKKRISEYEGRRLLNE